MRTKEKDTRADNPEDALAAFQKLGRDEKAEIIDWIKALLSAP